MDPVRLGRCKAPAKSRLSRAEMNGWLRKQAAERQIERLVSAKLNARIAGGEESACEELPVILEPGDDTFFDETPTQWAERVLTRKPKPRMARGK